MPQVQLDQFDLKILKIIQEDARIAQKDLGERVNLSTAAVNRRLKKLSDEGVIKSYTANIEPVYIGLPITIITMVEVLSEQHEHLDITRKLFSNCEYIQQSYYVAGEWDFVLIFQVKDMDQYTDISEKLFIKNNNVKRFKTLVAMKKDKASLSIPI
ncbi:Lrp/AsnC family transcriptional regulator [Acinetobacter seifertii]|uniref:Lrp/AsnC family transcriptional regulator n=1 Tax=Acinetobacter seifertii TaxID=1530123 RepID=UPI000C1E5DCA|nr:Lrp/AsnC family transcriptional regulator [Acinetobacter seifertii]PJF02636.1 AsnC family transcriptional regulator [Acinetobacter seifertii]PJG71838.1 AsnC family transcriptional regulator [Acinetobacter seifertii]